jgi:hypothetical protein
VNINMCQRNLDMNMTAVPSHLSIQELHTQYKERSNTQWITKLNERIMVKNETNNNP